MIFPSWTHLSTTYLSIPIVDRTMKHLRRYIRRLIKEAHDYGCNLHSLGYITDQGVQHISKMKNVNYPEAHSDILERLGLEWHEFPDGWIYLSNAKFMTINKGSWAEVSPEQIDAMIDVWLDCGKYTPWIKNEIEQWEVRFSVHGHGSEYSTEYLTIPDFLEKYAEPRHIDYLFNNLAG